MANQSIFLLELSKLGQTDKQRSMALGVTTKTIERYRAGQLPSIIVKMKKFPRLLHALAEDAENAEAEQEAAKCST
jgi:hypothetical protein